MKRIFTLGFILSLCFSLNFAQTLFNENFTGYTTGNLAGQNGWTKFGSGPDVTIDNATPLTYTNYTGGGEYVVMPTGTASTSRVYKAFTDTVPNSSNSIFYFSLLLRLTATTTPSTNYFISLGASGSSSTYGAKLFAQTNGTGFNIGLSKTSNTANFGTTVLNYNTTYLIVVNYTFNDTSTVAPGKLDDAAYLWVNPALTAEPSITSAECTANVTTLPADNDFNGFAPTAPSIGNFIWHNRGIANPVGAFDGVKVGHGVTSADAWTALGIGSAVPVELTSFAGSSSGSKVSLLWATATEVNNKGFEIQRKSNGSFENIAFVQGNGTSTEKHTYSYSDANVKSGTYTYRLKQVDFDGTATYSKAVEVEVNVPKVYALNQNYPNPFNPSTTIKFSLAVESKVSLTLFNVLGQEVSTLINSSYSPGVHEFRFNASNLNSGLYFYKIQASGIDGSTFSSVKKMMLTK